MSHALWIPAAWLFSISSRPISSWLGMTPQLNSPTDYLDGSPIDRAVLTALLIAALLVVVSRMSKATPLLKKNAPILVFFLYCGISILWSDFAFVAFKRWTKSVGDLLMALIILTEPDPIEALKKLVTRLGFVLFPLSILLSKYYPTLGRRLTNSWTMETVGLSTQKNQLGVTCMIYGLVFLWIFCAVYRDREDPIRNRSLLAYGTILAMIVWLLHACNSLTSIAGLAMAGGVMWLASRPRRTAVVHLLVLAVLGISLTALFFDPGGSLVGALGRDGTFSGRTEIWKLVLSIPTNPWVGTGFESFWLGNRAQALWDALPNFPINEAHNGYVEVYLNLGWAGISLLGLVLLTGYTRVVAALREDPARGSLLLGLFLATLFESLTEAAFRMMSPAWFFLLLVIIASSEVTSAELRVNTESELAASDAPVWAFDRGT